MYVTLFGKYLSSYPDRKIIEIDQDNFGHIDKNIKVLRLI